MSDPIRVLVLGNRGFIGRHVVSALRASGTILLPAQAPDTGAVDLLTADMDGMLAYAQPQVIVNCAGRTSGTPSELKASNVTLVARLLGSLRDRPGTRLVQIGSAAEYGRGTDAYTSEAAAERPRTPYGDSKLQATKLIRSSGIAAAVLRVFNPIGAGMSADSLPGRAALLIREAMNAGRGWIVLGSLAAERDFIDVRDVADAVAAAVVAEAPPVVVNIGTGRPTLARDVVAQLADIAGFRGEVREADVGSPRSEDVGRLIADSSLARDRLGWEPRRTLRDALTALWTG